ncbi:MAG TPA: universal stress protein [Abditibacteriaceae bacterium]|nr:universal stress protein [Abditibacteriaceae bacterium]
MLPLRKIICPLDFSEPAYAALDKAAELATHFDAELCLVHVVPLAPPFPSDLLIGAVDTVESDRAREEAAVTQLNEVVTGRLPGVRARPIVKMGYAANEIACVAEDEGADLIVISTHGLTGWHHLIFGSTTDKVLRLAKCPVLIVRHMAEAQAH